MNIDRAVQGFQSRCRSVDTGPKAGTGSVVGREEGIGSALVQRIPAGRRSRSGSLWISSGRFPAHGQVTRPLVLQHPSALKQVRAGIGCLDPVPDHMRQGSSHGVARLIPDPRRELRGRHWISGAGAGRWGPRTGPIRSQGLLILNSMATAHSNTARRRTRRAVFAFRCQMGVRISSTPVLVTSETGILPMRQQQSFLLFDLRQAQPPPCRADHSRVKQSEIDNPLVTLVSRSG